MTNPTSSAHGPDTTGTPVPADAGRADTGPDVGPGAATADPGRDAGAASGTDETGDDAGSAAATHGVAPANTTSGVGSFDLSGVTIGVDLGGTKIFVAPVAPDGTVHDRRKMDTPRGGPASVVAAIADMVGDLGLPPLPIGVGTPGMVRTDGTVVHAPNLAGWEGEVPLRDLLREALPDREIVIENDVNAGTLGELLHGAAVGQNDVLGVFVGTGVGGGLVLDGKLRRGPTGMAGELGHVVVIPDGRVCGCGLPGHLEAYAGRRGLETEARRRHGAGQPTLLVELAGDKRMKSGVFLRAYEAGDRLAIALLAEAVEALAVAVVSAAVLVDLDFVVVGGGLTEKFGPLLLDPLSAKVRERTYPGQALDIVPAALGDNAGVVGAAGLVA